MTRITRFEAENFKRLKVVEIDPDTNTVVIAGRNAQGKTSVLDAIHAALAGRAGSKELSRPIRDGEKKARVLIELDDLVVERKWTASGSTLTVSPKGANAKLNSPQKVLDELIGSLSFDPLEFATAEPKKQVATLIDLVGRERFDQIAAERKAAYDQRTEVNRDVKRLEAQFEATAGGVPTDYDGTDRINVAALVDEIEKVRRKAHLRAEWQRIEDQITMLQANQAALTSEARALPDGDLDQLTDRLSNAERHNAAHDASARALEIGLELSGAKGSAAGLTDKISSLDEEKADLLAKADLPVDGLTFDEDGVMLNGVPFTQSSAAERLKVSVAMAMALNPELRVICIRDASLLDDESRKTLVDMAIEHDQQIWYEVVGDGGPVGIQIEDGQVQA